MMLVVQLYYYVMYALLAIFIIPYVVVTNKFWETCANVMAVWRTVLQIRTNSYNSYYGTSPNLWRLMTVVTDRLMHETSKQCKDWRGILMLVNCRIMEMSCVISQLCNVSPMSQYLNSRMKMKHFSMEMKHTEPRAIDSSNLIPSQKYERLLSDNDWLYYILAVSFVIHAQITWVSELLTFDAFCGNLTFMVLFQNLEKLC